MRKRLMSVVLIILVFTQVVATTALAKTGLTTKSALAMVKKQYTEVYAQQIRGLDPRIEIDGETALVAFEVAGTAKTNCTANCGKKNSYNGLAVFMVQNDQVVSAYILERTADAAQALNLDTNETVLIPFEAGTLPELPVIPDGAEVQPTIQKNDDMVTTLVDQPMCQDCVHYTTVPGHWYLPEPYQTLGGVATGACGAYGIVCGAIYALATWVPGYTYCDTWQWLPCATPT